MTGLGCGVLQTAKLKGEKVMSPRKEGGSLPQSSKDQSAPDIHKMPEPIPDTPENIAHAVLNTPPKKDSDWKFMKGRTLEDL